MFKELNSHKWKCILCAGVGLCPQPPLSEPWALMRRHCEMGTSMQHLVEDCNLKSSSLWIWAGEASSYQGSLPSSQAPSGLCETWRLAVSYLVPAVRRGAHTSVQPSTFMLSVDLSSGQLPEEAWYPLYSGMLAFHF